MTRSCWKPIETWKGGDGDQIIAWTPEGLDVCIYLDPEPDGPQNMGHDGGWLGYHTGCEPGRSFGEPDFRRPASCQPTHWLPYTPPGDPQ